MIELSKNNCKGRNYIIKEGDTLYKISRLNNVPLDKLLEYNSSVNVYNLEVGDSICIPILDDDTNIENFWGKMNDINNISSDNSSDNSNNTSNTSNNNDDDDNERDGEDYRRMFVYVIKQGDTLDVILDKYNISIEDIMEANNQNKIMLKPGSIMIIPEESNNR